MGNPNPPKSPHYQALKDLDSQVAYLCKQLGSNSRIEPDDRIKIAQTILMLQTDRKTMVQEIMTQFYGSILKG